MTVDHASHPDWRLIQVFMSKRSLRLIRVHMHTLTRELVCDCPGTEARHRIRRGPCDHIRYVRNKIETCDGAYPIEHSPAAPPLTPEIVSNVDAFREWMLLYSPIIHL